MPYRHVLSLVLLVSCSAWGQSTGGSPAQKEVINQLEGAPAKETKPPAAEQKPQNSRSADPALAAVANTGLNQPAAPATALSNDDLLSRAKTIYVVSESFFVKREQLERGLINRKELGEWGLHVVDSPGNADLILKVRRAPFQNNFPFTFTDRVSGIVVMGGTVNSLFGTVPGKIAGRLADKLKDIYKKGGN